MFLSLHLQSRTNQYKEQYRFVNFFLKKGVEDREDAKWEGIQLYEAVDHSGSEHDTVGQPVMHASAAKHATGEAVFCDDVRLMQVGSVFYIFIMIPHRFVMKWSLRIGPVDACVLGSVHVSVYSQ